MVESQLSLCQEEQLYGELTISLCIMVVDVLSVMISNVFASIYDCFNEFGR